MKIATLLPVLALSRAGVALNNHYIRAGNATGNATTTCVPAGAVHMIVARASTEAPGEGIIGAVATSVKSAVAGSDSEAVDYPATLTDYTTSEPSGVAAMQKLIEAYATKCPDSKMALLGYSQGAQVAADIICGTSEAGFTSTPPLSAALLKNIVAVVLMGDPSHVPNLAMDVGNSTKAGVVPRANTTACGSSAAITQSYCNSGDKFCDSGNSVAVHLSYVRDYGTTASKFIADSVTGNRTAASATSKGVTSSTGTSSASTIMGGGGRWLGLALIAAEMLA